LKEGADVIINGRTTTKVERAVASLQNEFPDRTVSGIAADLSKAEETDHLLRQLPAIDILINNAGIFELKEFKDITDDEWMHIFQLNVMSGVRLSRHLLPGMLQRNFGKILFISSESGVNIPANMVHYGMTKTAMQSLANGLSKLTKGTGVTVNTILGGPTYSDGVAATVQQIAAAQGQPEEAVKSYLMQQLNPDSLLQRFITPEEIAALATYLCSPLAAATNGAAVRADGGVLNTL